MNRFAFHHGRLVALATAALLAGTGMLAVPQASYASDWGEILKPLVRDVLIPGAKLGVKKWNEHRNADNNQDPSVVEILPNPQESIIILPNPDDVTIPTADGPDSQQIIVISPDGSTPALPPPPP